MNKIWLISDTHFGHEKILEYCDRPFSSIREHDEYLIYKWNSKVEKDDTVVHCGDFALGTSRGYINSVCKKLNGKKRLVLGNHDIHTDIFAKYFKLYGSFEPRRGVICTHIPIHPMNIMSDLNRFKINIHGHTHNTEVLTYDSPTKRSKHKNYVNVSVEKINYTPVLLSKAIK